jgi:hypothetical protein
VTATGIARFAGLRSMKTVLLRSRYHTARHDGHTAVPKISNTPGEPCSGWTRLRDLRVLRPIGYEAPASRCHLRLTIMI